MRVDLGGFSVPTRYSEVQPGDWLYDGLISGKVVSVGKVAERKAFIVDAPRVGRTIMFLGFVTNLGAAFIPIEDD